MNVNRFARSAATNGIHGGAVTMVAVMMVACRNPSHSRFALTRMRRASHDPKRKTQKDPRCDGPHSWGCNSKCRAMILSVKFYGRRVREQNAGAISSLRSRRISKSTASTKSADRYVAPVGRRCLSSAATRRRTTLWSADYELWHPFASTDNVVERLRFECGNSEA